MLSFVARPVLAALLAGLAVCGARAQPLPSLREAVDAAWALSPQARSLASRQAELDARGRAASSWIAGAPTLSAAHRTDRIGSNNGLREDEVQLSAPLWYPKARTATARQVDAERAAFGQQQALARARLAGEVRELAAQAALAGMEQELAQRRLREAELLAGDVQRRVTAGERARVDLLQAQSLQRQAAAAEAQAASAVARAAAQWRALTGLSQVAVLDETLAGSQPAPALAAAQAQLQAAQARLALAQAHGHEPVEVGVGVTRERPVAGVASENSVRFSVRVPLGSDLRSAARLAAAQAEVDAAEAEAVAAERASTSEREAALAELEAARRSEALAAERERASREMQELIAKSWRLGESDLPTRLRADAERFEAELSHARARLETRRATARLNQANGMLP